MKNCEQSVNQSVLEHGISVKNYLFDLIDHLRIGTPLKYNWALPDWLLANKEFILSELPDDKTLKLYTIFHDCGKPKCLTIDSDNKKHFTNHAEVSHKTFIEFSDNKIAAELIKHDMDIHLLKSDGVNNFCQNPYAITLLLSGLAEIHSNAQMFGGLESTSFRIKKKSIFKRGKQIIEKIKTNYEN